MELLTISQAARALGLSAKTLRRLADDGRIPYTRLPSGYRRWSRIQLAQISRQMTVEPREQVAAR